MKDDTTLDYDTWVTWGVFLFGLPFVFMFLGLITNSWILWMIGCTLPAYTWLTWYVLIIPCEDEYV